MKLIFPIVAFYILFFLDDVAVRGEPLLMEVDDRNDDELLSRRGLGFRNRFQDFFHKQKEEQQQAAGVVVPPLSSYCGDDDDDQNQLMLAVRCLDGMEKLVCATPAIMSGTGTRTSSCLQPNPFWTNRIICQDNDGFDTVLPYYSGCYPKSISTFWNDYAPDDIANITDSITSLARNGNVDGDDDNICYVLDGSYLNVPPLPNMDFENDAVGLDDGKWNKTDYGGEWKVRQFCNHPLCVDRGNCVAYEGDCVAMITSGDTRYPDTPPQVLKRSDFRIPEVDTTTGGACTTTATTTTTTIDYCFFFAMRFDGRDDPTEGNDDRFTIKVQLNNDGPILYERNITISDVVVDGDGDDDTGTGGDTGWIVNEIPLPTAEIGDATYFTLEATIINVGDYGVESVAYLDSIRIDECTTSN